MAADLSKFKKTKELGRNEIFFCLARVPNSDKLYVGASDSRVYEVDLAAEKIEAKPFGTGHTGYVMGIALAGPYVVSGAYDGKLIWWNRENGEQVRTVAAHGKWIRGLSITPDGKRLISVSDDMLCKVWNAETGELIHTLSDHKPQTPTGYPSMLFCSAVSFDGSLLATGDKVGHVAVWDLATGAKVGEIESPGMYTWDPTARRHSIGGIRSVAFSGDSQQIAVGGIGKIGNVDHLDGPSRLELYDWRAGKSVHEVSDNKLKGLIEQLEYHPNGDFLVGAGGDHGGFINFYDFKAASILHQEKAPMHVHAAALNETRDKLYTVGHGRIVAWEFKADEPQPEAKALEAPAS
jgi:WD40 repeat protein